MSRRRLPQALYVPIRNVACVLAAASLLLVGVPTTAGAQTSQTAWHVNDDPRLEGPAQGWMPGQAGKGNGSNNYRFTYAIGDAALPENSAVWDMGRRVGRQEVQVFVPCNHAVATVTYEIRTGSTKHYREVRQYDECGHRAWTSLGQFDADGQTITITLADNSSRQDHHRDGFFWSSFGVDAMRMRCVSRCGGAALAPLTPTGLTYSVKPDPGRADRVRITMEWQASPAANEYRIVYAYGGREWPFSSPTNRHEVIAPSDLIYGVSVSALNSTGSSPAVRTTVSTSRRRAPSQSFWSDVGNPSVGASRLLDLYHEAADLQCSNGPLKWNHIAAVAMQEATHGQLPSRTSDVLPSSIDNEEFDVWPQITPDGPVRGPMQIQPRVWELDIWGTGGGFTARTPTGLNATGHGTGQAFPDIHNMRAAVHGAAAYLCHLALTANAEQGVGTGAGLADPVECAFAFYYSGPRQCVAKLNRANDANRPTIRQYATEVYERSMRYVGSGTVAASDGASGRRVSDTNAHQYPHVFTRCPVYDRNGDGVYDSHIDDWNFLEGQCTSYVAWQLNEAGIEFRNSFNNGVANRHVRWGNARNWSNQARQLGIRVDGNPAPGAVANWTASRFGHVAYVESVSNDGDMIVISESNRPGGSCSVSTRTIRRGDIQWPDSFIHFEAID